MFIEVEWYWDTDLTEEDIDPKKLKICFKSC